MELSEESKTYRLYDPVGQKIIINRDVVFDEKKSWDWDQSYEDIMADLECGDKGDTEAAMCEEAKEILEGSNIEVTEEQICVSPQPE